VRRLWSRMLSTVPVLLGISALVFIAMRLIPGDPVTLMTGELAVSAQQRAQLVHQLGLDRPVWMQFLDFLWRAVHGDLGESIRYKLPVTQLILSQAPATLELAAAAMLFASVIGGLAGLVAAVNRKRISDHIVMVSAMLGLCIPSFWLGLLLIFLFSLRLGWVPATGSGGLNQLILPAFALGVIYAATTARLVRSGMLETLQQDHIRTARAKGVSEPAVVLRHALKNTLIPVVTVIGLQFGQLLAGAVVVETVFARQGLGVLTVDAVLNKDYPVVQGTVLFIGAAFVCINFLVDQLYAVLDPRVRET